MLQSKLFTKTLRENPKDETAINAQLLERGGFVYKNSAGVYSYLPLGLRVLERIAKIVRQEMNAIGAQELLMPALVEKRYLDTTGRWDVEVGFEAVGKRDKKASFVLGWTHEEVLTDIASKYISSYKDLPFAAYQIQTKFRNEPRAKSGLLRGREFLMKDLYSFHASPEDFLKYYETVRQAYMKIFERCGLKAIYTVAAGGDFTASHTHEFQMPCKAGEDTIFVCQKCGYAENKEISKLQDGTKCPICSGNMKEIRSIEVGNIFPLGTKYSDAFALMFVNEKGEKQPVVMGSYGIGLGRVMATIVEIYHDENGIIWPKTVSPFDVHLVAIFPKDEGGRTKIWNASTALYEDLTKAGIGVLFDDREGISAGEKFADCDLIGMPLRLVVSEKTLEKDSVEIKRRGEKETKLVRISTAVSEFKKQYVQ
ncbi:MAG: aminoacyl--tRNA ligase-related protein [bacterium]|nr:aminoacyl--tRNA ligase-related protein [bacterium]